MHAQAELEASFRVDGARLSLQRESRPPRSRSPTSPPTHHGRPGGQPHIDVHRSCATSRSGDGDRVTMTYPSLPMTVLVSHPRFCLGSPCQGLWQGEPAHMGTCEMSDGVPCQMSDGVPCETSCAHVSPRAFPAQRPSVYVKFEAPIRGSLPRSGAHLRFAMWLLVQSKLRSCCISTTHSLCEKLKQQCVRTSLGTGEGRVNCALLSKGASRCLTPSACGSGCPM